MNIICDTNIWYNIPKDAIKFSDEITFITPILVIEEFTITDKIDKDPEKVKIVLQKMMRRKKGEIKTIINPSLPFFCFFYIGHPEPPVYKKADTYLEFTSRLANSLATNEFIEATKEYRKERNEEYRQLVDIINATAKEIGGRIENREYRHYQVGHRKSLQKLFLCSRLANYSFRF